MKMRALVASLNGRRRRRRRRRRHRHCRHDAAPPPHTPAARGGIGWWRRGSGYPVAQTAEQWQASGGGTRRYRFSVGVFVILEFIGRVVKIN